jgi:hypothetical protein
MTSIRYVKLPKIKKLDGRFKLYKYGFTHRVTFDTQQSWDKFMLAVKWCERTYGPDYDWEANGVFSRKIWNHNWRLLMPKEKRFWREFYLRSEQDVTMMLLVVGG